MTANVQPSTPASQISSGGCTLEAVWRQFIAVTCLLGFPWFLAVSAFHRPETAAGGWNVWMEWALGAPLAVVACFWGIGLALRESISRRDSAVTMAMCALLLLTAVGVNPAPPAPGVRTSVWALLGATASLWCLGCPQLWEKIRRAWVGLMVASAIVVLVAWPITRLIIDATDSSNVRRIEEPSLTDKLNIAGMELITGGMFFAVGAALGSFLNAAAWRWRSGKSIVTRDSRCPACDTVILRRDNLPILGWLLLRGRCRACGVSIPKRYVLVEIAVGLLLLGLALVELLSGGANLPVRTPNTYRGVVWIIWFTKWDLVGYYLFHATLLCTLFAAGLVGWDRARTPRRFLALALVVALVSAACWPFLLPISWNQPALFGSAGAAATHLQRLSPLLGLLGGIPCGLWLQWCSRSEFDARLLPLCGAFLGWQAMLGATWLTAVFFLLLALRQRWFRPTGSMFNGAFFLAVLMQLFAWRWLNGQSYWPGTETEPMHLLSGATLCLAASCPIRWIRTQPSIPCDAQQASQQGIRNVL